MKQRITLLLAVMTVTISYGQITTTKVAPKVEQVDNSPFDSTGNFLALSPNKYIGQEFYLKGLSESLRQYGYSGFALDYNKSMIANKGNVYKCCDRYNSKYADLTGKYFKVLDVIKHPKAITGKSTDEFLYGNKWFIKLQEKISGDIAYFEFDGKFEHTFPFIVVGFFEKQKNILIGQEFVFADKVITSRFFGDANANPSTDMNTGKQLTIVSGEKWKCLDLTVEEEHYTLSLVIQNSLGEKTTMDYNTVFGKWSKGRAYTATDADKYRKDFGSEIFDLILKGKCRIGMTKEMCRLSWGEPKDINETITEGKKTEQWVYGKNYLYFDNGVVIAMQ